MFESLVYQHVYQADKQSPVAGMPGLPGRARFLCNALTNDDTSR